MVAIFGRLLAYLLLAVACLTMVGCGTPGRLADNASVRTVGNIAAVPETLHLNHYGLWSGHDETVSIPWELNKTVAAEARRLLQRRYAASVVSTTARVAYVPELANWVGSSGPMVSEVANIAKPGEYDVLLVVTGSDGCYVHYSSVPRRYPAYISLGYRLELFDGRTFKPLASRNLDVSNPVLITGTDNPYRDIDFGWRGEPFASIPEARKQAMRSVALQIIAEGLSFSLPRLGML